MKRRLKLLLLLDFGVMGVALGGFALFAWTLEWQIFMSAIQLRFTIL